MVSLSNIFSDIHNMDGLRRATEVESVPLLLDPLSARAIEVTGIES